MTITPHENKQYVWIENFIDQINALYIKKN